MRRPQRTEAAQRLEARIGAYLCGALEGGGEQTSGPARSQAEAASAEARARGVPRPLFSQQQHGERVRCGTGRAAQHCTRRARGVGVVPSPSNAALSSAAYRSHRPGIEGLQGTIGHGEVGAEEALGNAGEY